MIIKLKDGRLLNLSAFTWIETRGKELLGVMVFPMVTRQVTIQRFGSAEEAAAALGWLGRLALKKEVDA